MRTLGSLASDRLRPWRPRRSACRCTSSRRGAMNSTGSIWPKRSSTPCSPKSGEQDDQTAPSEAAASMPATASGMFGIIAATRSPFLTPSETKAAAGARPARGARPRTGGARPCPRRGRRCASPEPRLRSRFSAKFSRASGKNAAPGILSPSTSTRSPFSPTTPQKSQTRLQKSSRSSTDQRCSSA